MPSPIFMGQLAVLSHQSWLNVVGNNLANINTFGFKGSRMRFGDIIGATIGGIAFGNGVNVTGVDTNFSQGALQATGQALDLALDGPGFFTLDDGNKNVFTRVGAFDLNEGNFMVDRTTGYRVLDSQGNSIKIDPDQFRVDGSGSTKVDLVGNLDNSTLTNGTYKTSTTVFDEKGNQHTLNITFTRVDSTTPTNQWTAVVTSPESGVTFPAPNTDALNITFDSAGNPPASVADELITVNFGGGLADQNLTISFSDTTMNAGASNLKEGSKDGKAAITFNNIVVTDNGEVRAVKSDGSSETVTALGISVPDNLEGLKAVGNGIFETTNSTGVVKLGRAEEGGSGTVRSGFLETSNVDLTSELVNLIVAQRGFSTGAKIITTSDQVLQETLQLKR